MEQEAQTTTPAPAPTPAHPLELFQLAEAKTRKLVADERRSVIAYITEYGFKGSDGKYKDFTNYELADVFQVDEAVIRRDKKKILKEQCGELTPEDSMRFVQEFLQEHNGLIRKAKDGLRTAPLGTLTHIRYLQTLSELEVRKIKLLQESGLLPKELGHLTVTEEEWVAYVLEDGVTGVKKPDRPALPPASEQPDDGEVFEAEILDAKEDDQAESE